MASKRDLLDETAFGKCRVLVGLRLGVFCVNPIFPRVECILIAPKIRIIMEGLLKTNTMKFASLQLTVTSVSFTQKKSLRNNKWMRVYDTESKGIP